MPARLKKMPDQMAVSDYMPRSNPWLSISMTALLCLAALVSLLLLILDVFDLTGVSNADIETRLTTEAIIVVILFVLALSTIIFQRRRTYSLRERVARQRDFINTILNSSLDAIIFIDNNNKVRVWNSGAELIFGYSKDEMLGQTFQRLIPPDMDADKELQQIRNELNEKGTLRHYRASRITKSEDRITIDLSRTLVKSEDGEKLGSIAIIKDVTEKLEFEQRIYNTEKLASIGNLAAGVAHEINNPLAVILGFADLLKERFDSKSQDFQDLTIIEENANHAKEIVEDLLGFARVTEGEHDQIQIKQALETVITIIKNTLLPKAIKLKLNIASNISNAKGDVREFQQVIFNLINNSIAAMKNDGGSLTIVAENYKKWVRIKIIDTGCGIPKKIQHTIFDPFFTTKKVGEGTGLGLSLCYGILTKYGGRIEFESLAKEDFPDKESGSTFIIYLLTEDNNSVKESE